MSIRKLTVLIFFCYKNEILRPWATYILIFIIKLRFSNLPSNKLFFKSSFISLQFKLYNWRSDEIFILLICVSLVLFDYIKDGLNIYKLTNNRYIVGLFSFIPPLLAVIFYPDSFIALLSLAGFLCVILQALIPALIIFKGRYAQGQVGEYKVAGGKLSLGLAILGSLLVVVVALI